MDDELGQESDPRAVTRREQTQLAIDQKVERVTARLLNRQSIAQLSVRDLVDRIKAWREDDGQGYFEAIELLCAAETFLMAYTEPPQLIDATALQALKQSGGSLFNPGPIPSYSPVAVGGAGANVPAQPLVYGVDVNTYPPESK